MKPFGKAIRVVRVQKGLTQEDLAKALGVTRPRVVQVESGRHGVTEDLLGRIAAALGVTPSAIVMEAEK